VVTVNKSTRMLHYHCSCRYQAEAALPPDESPRELCILVPSVAATMTYAALVRAIRSTMDLAPNVPIVSPSVCPPNSTTLNDPNDSLLPLRVVGRGSLNSVEEVK
jgi:hypothetical protein